ncbi:MAG: zinc-binding dehydrogenase [Oligoflexia bacterium]|nr:zinc-binding dehydrogenase [Oligoflexia bacterium]
MKAIFFEQHGGIEVLKYGEIPDPQPAPGEALIKVKACALNHLDVWVRKGWKGLHLEWPHVTGCDIAGEIVAVNTSSTNWKPGTKVIVNPGIASIEDEWTRRGEECVSPGYRIIGEQIRGGMAEYLTVPVANVFKMPDELNFEQAAAPLLVGTTCWRMLFERGGLKPHESVLVVGSGGGVNSLAIQIAHTIGATIYALAGSKEKRDKALSLGASEAIDYSRFTNWPVEIMKLTKGRGVDLVIDNVGSATLEKSMRSVARGGRIVTVGNTSGYEVQYDNRLIFAKQISLIGSTMGSRQDFIEMLQFLLRHKIMPVIDTVAPLKDGIQMIKRLEDGKQFGKIILKP